MCRVFEQTHGVFNDHFVIKTQKVDNLFHDPRFDDRQVHFPHVNLQSKTRKYRKANCKATVAPYLFVKALGKFH